MAILFLFIFAILLFAVSNKRWDVASKRMMLLFVGYWGIALTWSAIGVSDYNKPGTLAYILLLANVFMFLAGFSFLSKGAQRNKGFSSTELHSIINRLISSKTFSFVLVLSVILSVYYYIKMQVFYAAVGDLDVVRGAYFDNSLMGYEYIWLNHLFLKPFHYICIPVFGYMLFFRRDWRFVFVILFLLPYTSLDGGRFGYLRIALGVIFVFFCLFNDTKYKLKQFFYLGAGLLVFLYLMAVVTNARGGGEQSLAEGTFTAFSHYLCGPMSAFDYAITHDYIDRMGGYTYGRLSFASVDGLLRYALQIIGIDIDDPLSRLVEFKQGERILIGSDSTWNAQYTSQLYPWLDAGVLGCILFPFIFGMGFGYLINLFAKYRNWQFLVLVSAFFQINMHSVSDFGLYSPFTLLAFLFIYYLGKHTRNYSKSK